jgi:hypothetical protein
METTAEALLVVSLEAAAYASGVQMYSFILPFTAALTQGDDLGAFIEGHGRAAFGNSGCGAVVGVLGGAQRCGVIRGDDDDPVADFQIIDIAYQLGGLGVRSRRRDGRNHGQNHGKYQRQRKNPF